VAHRPGLSRRDGVHHRQAWTTAWPAISTTPSIG
jgi:hypothetical protein